MRVVRCVLGFLALFSVAAAQAQSYPSKPVKLIVPFPPGGSTDLVARSITTTLGDFLGQQVVIEYKGGAAGSIGTAEVARATPHGYTLLSVWDTHGVNHHLYNVQYDFFKPFDPDYATRPVAGHSRCAYDIPRLHVQGLPRLPACQPR